jgi:predicted nucleotidyltransferase
MNLQRRYQNVVAEFLRRLLEKYRDRIERIILFGSVARGTAEEDSDIDILVVGDITLDELVNISYPLLLEHGELISAKNMDKDHFNFLVQNGYSFIRNVLEEGIILYERMGEAVGSSRREAEIS